VWIKKFLAFRRELLPAYAVSKKFQKNLSKTYNAKFLRFFGDVEKFYTFIL